MHTDEMKYLDQISKVYQFEIENIRKMCLNMYSLHSIRFWYSKLNQYARLSDIQENLTMIEGLTTSIIISYGRIFQSGKGATRIRRSKIPEDLRKVHDGIMELRNKKYAHHEIHKSVTTKVELAYEDSKIVIVPKLEVYFHFGAPVHWAALFEWLDEYFYNNLAIQVSNLEKKSGIPWVMPHGDPPPWISTIINGEL